MTLVDTRRAGGRSHSRGSQAWPDPLDEAETVDHPDVRRGHRPGALGAWLIGFVIGAVAVGIGAATTGPHGSIALGGFVVAAALASGCVRRGRSLRVLVGTVPLIFVGDLAIGAAIEIGRGGEKVSRNHVALSAFETAVLHAPWLWAGMVAALLVGLRRGILRRLPR